MRLYELWHSVPSGVTIYLEDKDNHNLAIIDEEAKFLPHEYDNGRVFYIAPHSSNAMTVKIIPPDDD